MAAALVWSCARIWFVATTLGRYGVNPWLYAAVELGSSTPYALGASRTVRNLAARRPARAARWGALAVVCFLLPDLTIVLSGRGLPWWTFALLGTVAAGGAAMALRDGRRRLGRLRPVEPAA